MVEINLHTPNPLDIPPTELGDLVATLRLISPDCDISVTAGDQRGAAVTWWEVIHVHLPWDNLSTAVAAAVAREAVVWLRERFAKDKRRPKSLTIFGPTGKPLKKILLKSENDPFVLDSDEDD